MSHRKTAVLYGSLALSLIILITGLFLDSFLLILLPVIVVAALMLLSYPKDSFFLFFGILPFSIEVYFSNSLGTDLPTEPLILFFFGWTILLLFTKKFNSSSIRQSPILIFLFLHLFWIAFSSIYAEIPLVSFKFLAAKFWYVVPFFFLSQFYFCDEDSVKKWIKIFLFGFAISVSYVFIRHLSQGLSFDSIGWAVSPLYRNHVNYAALLTIALPMSWYISKHGTYRLTYKFLLAFFLVAIYFSFTRAAMLTVFLMLVAAGLIRFKLLFLSTMLATLAIISVIFYFSIENRYLHLAPNYESTVAHDKFDNLMEATYELEDISTMERLHRWIAGFNMVSDRPWTGFGPNNFYFNYKPHTNYSFKTYVSDNPDRSGIHNYYLMTAVEQGVPGLIILMSFLFSIIYAGERLYHRVSSQSTKDIVMMALLMTIAIISFNLINDLMEAVKVGPFIFIAAGLIHRIYTQSQG